MPTYNPQDIEPRWQRFWLENRTFRTPDDSDKPKFYILDMFPYPSGSGLHVGHPEGYTATDIIARQRRMRGWNVLHPMGWDAFGLPAEKYAVKTGQHPRLTTQANIATFRRQINALGFSYDWERAVDTTDPNYYKWTQWIFLEIFDTWYDAERKRGRPIRELPIPAEIRSQGEAAVRRYQDSKRLAYQAEVPVNWCQELSSVLANEEVEDGKSKDEGYPVVRMPLRQWLLRITDYAERLLEELALVDWPEPIKKMQRDWIGRSEGAEVDFGLQHADLRLKEQPTPSGNPPAIRVFTTRPDTLFGATYMVLAPEHPLVSVITAPAQRALVEAYQREAAGKSELERTGLTKKKTGVPTGAFAINPVNGAKVPIWIADYVLATYGTAAIMAVPAHDERDFQFAREFKLPIRTVVVPPEQWLQNTTLFKHLLELAAPRPSIRELSTLQPKAGELVRHIGDNWQKLGRDPLKVAGQLYLEHPEAFDEVFVDEGTAVNSGEFDGLPTAEFKRRITAWLQERGQGSAKVNYKLRDWLFSRQRYWGEPFPILHELDAGNKPTGLVRALAAADLPLCLPELEDYKPTGKPEPPLEKAKDWLYLSRDGQRYRRETNTMPQWAGSCWYYLRYLDPKNDRSFCDPARERRFMPVDLYVGGAEHAVLHLLYARFWHKVLFDRGHVHTAEPFGRLVNQGMILGEMQYHLRPDAYLASKAVLEQKGIAANRVEAGAEVTYVLTNKAAGNNVTMLLPLADEQVEKRKGAIYLAGTDIELTGRADKMSKSRGNVVNPDDVVAAYGADSLRLYEMFMGPLEAVKPWSMQGVKGVYRFLDRVWRMLIDDRAPQGEGNGGAQLADAVQDVEPDKQTLQRLHKTIKKVTEDIDELRFNTAIAAMMEFTNYMTGLKVRPRSVLRTFVLLLSPFAPHLGEELWRALGAKDTLAYEPWPTFDEALTRDEKIEVPVQVNGKLRAKLTVTPEVAGDKARLEAAALADGKVKAQLEGKPVKKVIVVPGKLVSIVVGN